MSENNTTQTAENTQPKPKKDWKALEVGAIWSYADDRMNLRMKNKDGKEIRFVCFKNKFKDFNNRDDDKLPAWRVYKDDSEYNPTAQPKSTKPVEKKEVKKTAPAPEPEEEFV